MSLSRKNTNQDSKMSLVIKREHSVSSALVFKWNRLFSDDQDSLKEQECRGRKTKYGATKVTSIRDTLAADRRLMIRKLVDRCDMVSYFGN